MSNLLVFDHAPTLSQELAVAVEAARLAGQVIRVGYERLLENASLAIEKKGIGDLVSQVDFDADRAISSYLADHSDHPVLSEELNADVPNTEDLWIVDPLDASSAFLMRAGVQYPAVLIALQRHGSVALGVCYFPLTEEWFYAQKSRGAWKNGKRLVCDSQAALSDIWVETNQYGAGQKETEYFAGLRRQLRSIHGASLVTSNAPYSGVAMRIAEGGTSLEAAVHDNNPADVKQAPWDIAAPQLILEEAGGVFLNPAGKASDPFTPEPIIVARSKSLAQQIIDLGVLADKMA